MRLATKQIAAAATTPMSCFWRYWYGTSTPCFVLNDALALNKIDRPRLVRPRAQTTMIVAGLRKNRARGGSAGRSLAMAGESRRRG
jgi:hypothetical protein